MISVTTKYAVIALEHLSRIAGDDFVSIRNLAVATGVAAPYLAKVMKSLAAKDLVDSKKGLNGGVRLKRQGPVLTLYEVAVALDDPITRQACFLSRTECDADHACAFHSHWSNLRARIFAFLRDTVIWDPENKKLRHKAPVSRQAAKRKSAPR